MTTGKINVSVENIFPLIKKFLYSDHEIFLRELVSNATDATLKLKHLTSIGEAKTEYGNAMNKLVEGKGNLITSVEKLKKMGAKAKKALPESILKRAETDENKIELL